MRRIVLTALIACLTVGTAAAQSCDSKAMSANGKPLHGAAKMSFVHVNYWMTIPDDLPTHAYPRTRTQHASLQLQVQERESNLHASNNSRARVKTSERLAHSDSRYLLRVSSAY